jgi:hypothetical protein
VEDLENSPFPREQYDRPCSGRNIAQIRTGLRFSINFENGARGP